MKVKVEKDTLLLTLVLNKGGYASSSGARKLIKNRNVYVNGEPQPIPATLVKSGDVVEIIFTKKRNVVKKVVKFPFPILYDEGGLIAFEKPSGMPIHTTDKKLNSVLKELRYWLDKNPEKEELYIINKIDKRESGLVLATADLRLKKLLVEDPSLIKKRYYVITEGYPKYREDKLTNRLKRNKIGLLFLSPDKNDTEVAVLNYRIMNAVEDYALLKIEPETDIKNQIRAQLAINKNPIIGDKKYKSTKNPLRRLGIHLFSLEFDHPKTDKKITITTKVPKEFLRLAKGRKMK